MISDHFMNDRGWKQYPQQLPQGPNISWQEWYEYLELKRKAEEYDKKTSQPDCQKPELESVEKAIENVLRKKGIIK